MNRLLFTSALLAASLALRAADLSADSARGEQVFERLSCVQCHSVNGRGGKAAPDLGQMVDRGFTPATLAATMWNHAPGMWAAMQTRQISAGELNEQAAQDLMAFFYSARFFEKPGDAGRGKRAFQSRGCQGCHGQNGSGGSKAKPPNEWEALDDPIALVEAMWNHRAEMQAANASKGAPSQQITAQELTDVLVYLRNLPGSRGKPGVFRIEPSRNGEAVFESAGCAKCHKALDALAQSVQGQTLTEIAAEMWNHAPRMAAAGAPAVALAPGQMRDLVSAIWATKFFSATGHAAAGSRVFTAKNCSVCHNDAASGAPHLPVPGREFSGASMVSVLWRHGPRMLDLMKSKSLAWPRFDGSQMADLIAYLNSDKTPVKPGQP